MHQIVQVGLPIPLGVEAERKVDAGELAGEAGLRRRLAASAATDLRAPPRPSGGPFLGGGDGGGAPAPALLRIWIASAARISR